jgi:hypothetical protein
MADAWNIKSNEIINNALGALDDKVNNWATENIKNPVQGFADGLTDKVSGFANNISSKIPSKLGDDLEKINSALGFDIENINLRDKLKVECPNFMKQCGLSQVDFGTIFLNPQQEALIAQGQNIANDTINTLNALQNYLTPEALQSVVEVVQFIITDLIQQIINYALSVFQSYVSPGFVVGLAKDMVTSSIRYTTENTKDPAKLLEEIIKDAAKVAEDTEKTEKQKKQAELMAKINDKFVATQEWIKKAMDTIQPYTAEIAKYMTMGPDYACNEIEALYKKYLTMGISYVNTQLGELNGLIDDWVDSGAEATGKFAAEKINKLQEKTLAKAKKLTDTKLQQVKIKALSLINKAIMNLMAMLGG